MCVCVPVCPPPRIVITSGMMCHDMTLYDWLNNLSIFGMTGIVVVVSRCGLAIEARCRKQPNKTKLALYKPLLHLYNHLKQLYISNKTWHFSYKSGCDIHGYACIQMFKTIVGLSYRYTTLGY